MCLYKVKELESVKQPKDVVQFYPTPPGGGGVLPYIGYTGMCRWRGYGFKPFGLVEGMVFKPFGLV